MPTWSCRPAPHSKKKAPSPAPNDASSASTKQSSPSANRRPTGRSFNSSPTAWAPTGTTRIPSEIMDEVARLTPLFAGVSYDRLEGFNSLQWPVHADGTDSPLLFTEKFPFPDGKAKFYPVEYDSALRRGQRTVRPSPQQRPAARALRAGQHDRSHRRHQGHDALTPSSKSLTSSPPSAASPPAGTSNSQALTVSSACRRSSPTASRASSSTCPSTPS